jgi:hypothetical protein
LLGDFVRLCKHYRMRRLYLGDSLSVAAVVTILDLEDYRPAPQPKDTSKFARYSFLASRAKKGPQNWVRDALSVLTKEVFFADLYAQSDEIKRRLKHCKAPEEEKVKLLALCRLDEGEREELLAREGLPLWVRARHGDEDAEKPIVGRLNAEIRRRNYPFTVYEARNASLAATDRCLKAMMHAFEHDIYKHLRQGDRVVSAISAHRTILELLSRHYPDEPLLQERLYAGMHGGSPEEKEQFFRDFARWAERNYDVKPFRDFRPYFSDRCDEQNAKPGEHCPDK